MTLKLKTKQKKFYNRAPVEDAIKQADTLLDLPEIERLQHCVFVWQGGVHPRETGIISGISVLYGFTVVTVTCNV